MKKFRQLLCKPFLIILLVTIITHHYLIKDNILIHMELLMLTQRYVRYSKQFFFQDFVSKHEFISTGKVTDSIVLSSNYFSRSASEVILWRCYKHWWSNFTSIDQYSWLSSSHKYISSKWPGKYLLRLGIYNTDWYCCEVIVYK